MIKQQITEVVATKLAIYPKNIGLTEDEFPESGRVALVRIIYKKREDNNYNFKYIEAGDSKLDFYHIINAYSFPPEIQDYPFNFEFKKGDLFILNSDCEIECVELFIGEKINLNRLNNYSE